MCLCFEVLKIFENNNNNKICISQVSYFHFKESEVLNSL